tara:strand:- start:5704 stop:6546 length:843 start_codon:yes stop_codon:yes gene_type:complete
MGGLATGLAIAGLTITAGTTANSFIQAGREKKNQLKYESDADKALADARRALEVNHAKLRSIKKDPYEKERLAMLSAGEQVLSSAQDSDRGAASAAGQVMIGGQVTQSNITDRQSDELINIEDSIVEEESRLRDIGVGLNFKEIQGAQEAAADARNASAQAKAQGYEGLANTASQSLGLVNLYGSNNAAQQDALSKTSFGTDEFASIGNIAGKGGGASKSMGAAAPDGFTNLDLDRVGQLSGREFRQFKRELTDLQKRQLFMNSQYTDQYNLGMNPVRIN